MKISKLLVISMLSASMMAITSCDKDNAGETIYRYPFTSCYAVVTDLSNNNTQTISSPVSISMDANWTTGKAEMTISGIEIGGSSYPAMTTSKTDWQLLDNMTWGEVTGSTVGTLATGAQVLLSGFKFDWADRADLTAKLIEKDPTLKYDPAVSFSYVIDGKYKVAGARHPFRIAGETTSTPAGGEGFTSNVSLYTVSLDFINKVASIKVQNASFAQGMPLMEMEFPGIAYSIDENAVVSLSCDALTPTMGGVPMPNYPISDLRATIRPGREKSQLHFVCNFRGLPFTVEASLDFTSYEGFIGVGD